MSKIYSISILTVSVVLMFIAFVFYQTQSVQSSGYVGLAVTQRMATTTTVGPDTEVNIFNALPSCTARTIATNHSAITFITGEPTNGDLSSTTLTASNGLIQAASTTVTYEAGMNGCGEWWALGTASGTITLVEYQ